MTVETAALRTDVGMLRQPPEKAVIVHAPYVVCLLLLANVVVFALGLAWGLPQQIRAFGFQPASPTLPTLLASMFVHAGVWHIANNMIVLLLVGGAIEGWVGHVRFAFIYLASGMVGAGAHALAASNPRVFLVGASGAISGLMGAALVGLFPSGSDAAAKLIAWFLAQLILAAVFSWIGTNVLGVAVWAHIGGFLAGLVLGFLVGVQPGQQHDSTT